MIKARREGGTQVVLVALLLGARGGVVAREQEAGGAGSERETTKCTLALMRHEAGRQLRRRVVEAAVAKAGH
eukprot:COSAG06_NODE_20355_length_798_cov_23.248927_1_plen_72_part_00